MKTDKIKVKEGSGGDKSLVWTVSDAYVNWCQIVVGNPGYLEKLYSSEVSHCDTKECLDCLNQLDTFPLVSPTGNKIAVKGPCHEEELSHWRKLNELIQLKKKCSELQRRLENETLYKFKMAITPDCRKRAIDCPCIPSNKDQYVKNLPKIDVKPKKEKQQKKKIDDDNDDAGDSSNDKNEKSKKTKKNIQPKGDETKGAGVKQQQQPLADLSVETGCNQQFVLSKDGRKIEENKIFTFKTDNSCFKGQVFKQRDCGEQYFYPNGKIGAHLECDGTGKLFYPNGEIAVTVTKGKLGCRLLVMSKSGHSECGKYYTSIPIAMFDSKGNGVVYDLRGNIRMNYDQAEGILYDTRNGLPVRWQWQLCSYIKKRRQQLESFPITDQDDDIEDSDSNVVPGSKKSKGMERPRRKTRESMHKSSLSKNDKNAKRIGDKFTAIKEAVEWSELVKYDKVAIEPRPIALKLNQHFSIRILKQDHIHLDFHAYPLHFHINLGVTIEPQFIERIDMIKYPESQTTSVPCYFEILYQKSKSLRNLHSDLEKARKELSTEDRISFIKRAKLMGVLKNITRMAMKTLDKDEYRLKKVFQCKAAV